MAIATRILEFDHAAYQSLNIEDSDGQAWIYMRGAPVPSSGSATPDINWPGSMTGFPPNLVLADDGQARLRQSAAGLPPTAIVRLESAAPQAPMPVGGAWGGLDYEYDQQ